jgi:purine nucleosidase
MPIKKTRRAISFKIAILWLLTSALGSAQQRRKVIIDEDCSGPAGKQHAGAAGDDPVSASRSFGHHGGARKSVARRRSGLHAACSKIIGRSDIPVVPRAIFPLVRTREEAQLWQQRYGKVAFAGAWDEAGGMKLQRWLPFQKDGPPPNLQTKTGRIS